MKKTITILLALFVLMYFCIDAKAMTFVEEWGTFPTQNIYTHTTNGTKSVQYILKIYGENVTIDGNFGSQTKQAVMAYQSDCNGIVIDGSVGSVTWSHLFATMTTLTHHVHDGYHYYMYLPISGENYKTGYNFRRTNTAWQYKGANTIKGGF